MRGSSDIGSQDAPTGRTLRILVCPHELVTGGSQINAIDLAAELRDRGHEVRIFAPPGPLEGRIREKGLDFVAAPAPRPGFGLSSAVALARQLRDFAPDIVHAFESWPTVASVLASWARPHRLVVTVMSMSVPDYLPEGVPLTAGTGQLVDQARTQRSGQVHLLEPPTDTRHDAPGDMATARAALGVSPGRIVVSVVGRLSGEHQKARGVADAIDQLSAAELPTPLTLLVAGAGDDEETVRAAAARAAGSDSLEVRLLGNVEDPRAVYDSADIVFGMGGSALRAMAHEKPVIVQGREGFWQLLTPDTVSGFFAEGYFGSGTTGGPSFADIMADLSRDEKLRRKLGAFNRTLVLERYSLARAAEQLEEIYRDEVRRHPVSKRDVLGAGKSMARFARFRVAVRAPGLQRTYRSLTGRRSD